MDFSAAAQCAPHSLICMTALTIRPATIEGTDVILHFVRKLAIYEKAELEVLATV